MLKPGVYQEANQFHQLCKEERSNIQLELCLKVVDPELDKRRRVDSNL